MSDLISRSAVMQKFIDEIEQSRNRYNCIHINTIKRLLSDIEIAYDVNKVEENVSNYLLLLVGKKSELYKKVIGMIKAGGKSEDR